MSSLGNFRKSAQQIISNRGGGGGRKANWRMKWKPPHKTGDRQVAEPIVIVAADYLNTLFNKETGQVFQRKDPFHAFGKHTFKRTGGRGKSGIDIKELVCSAGPNRHAPQPCVCCYEVDHGAKGADARDCVAFNMAHLMPYHMVPLRDRQTQAVVYKKDQAGNPTQDAILVEEQCTLQGCQYCQQNAQYKQNFFPLKFGAQRIMELGTGHLQTILALDAKVGAFCANCRSNIKRLGFSCPNPTCQAPLLDIATCGWTNEQIDEFARHTTICQSCHQEVAPEEDIDCGYDPQGFYKIPGKGCPDNVNPVRLTLFDCVFYLQREGQDAQTKMVDTNWMPISDFMTPPDAQGQSRPLPECLKEIIKAPLNFGEHYSPLNLDEQAKILGVPNPYAQQSQYQTGPQGGQPAQYPGQQQGGYPPQYPPQAQAPQYQAPAFPPQGQPGQPMQYPPQTPQAPVAPAYPNIPVPGKPNYS